MARILIVEDDKKLALSLQRALEAVGHVAETVDSVAAGVASTIQGPFDVVVTDFQFPSGVSGLDLIKQVHERKPELPIIFMTAYPSTTTAIEAAKYGAQDFIPKGAETIEQLLKAIERAVERNRPLPVGEELNPQVLAQEDSIIGRSALMLKVYQQMGRVADKSVTVLIRGETGTGKELVARALHHHSDRSNHQFVAVNCIAIPETLLESELFGHEPGAFTGATARRIGRFEQANNGTIFLDEIGDMTVSTQAKLLRVLQDKTIQRLGGKETIPVDVRVLAATHRNLEEAMRDNLFREDLFYRLSVAVIELPPLRARTGDIPEIVQFFVHRHGTELGSPNVGIAKEAIEYLQGQEWPGNVRELENVVRRALLSAQHHAITLEVAREATNKSKSPPKIHFHVGDFIGEMLARAQRGELENVQAALTWDIEYELYRQAIQLAKGNQALAARWLGVSRPTMREKLRQYGILPTPDETAPET